MVAGHANIDNVSINNTECCASNTFKEKYILDFSYLLIQIYT